MEVEFIPDENGKGFIMASIGEDVEYTNPIEFYKKNFIEQNSILDRTTLLLKNPGFSPEGFEPAIKRHAEQGWIELFNSIINTEIPGSLFAALKISKKSYQEKLLRSVRFTPDMMAAFFFRASSEFGFTYSKYASEHLPMGTDECKLPKLVHVDRRIVKKVGETPMTDGELKQIVERRSGIVAHFIDKGEEWHCFFSSIESLAGKENWQEGQPHFHYISDKSGISRAKVVTEVKSRVYGLFGLPHIPLDGYREKE